MIEHTDRCLTISNVSFEINGWYSSLHPVLSLIFYRSTLLGTFPTLVSRRKVWTSPNKISHITKIMKRSSFSSWAKRKSFVLHVGGVSLSVSVCGNGKGPDQWPFLQNMKVEHTEFRDSFMSLCVFFLTPVHDLDPKKCLDANTLKDQYLGQIPGGKKKRKGKQNRENHFLAGYLQCGIFFFGSEKWSMQD